MDNKNLPVEIVSEENEDCKPKRFAVIESMTYNPETGIGRSTWYGDFDTREEAEKYIEDNKLSNVGILDLLKMVKEENVK